MDVIHGIKSVNQFLGDLVDAVKDTPWPKAVAKALPWAGELGKAASEVVAPIKFILKLYEGITKIKDVDILGVIACTTAFERSVQQAINTFDPDNRVDVSTVDKETQKQLRELKRHEATRYDFSTFKIEQATAHPFFQDAKDTLEQFAKVTELDEPSRRRLIHIVESRFALNLRLLLTHPDTKEKFDPFLQMSRLRSYFKT